MKPAKKEPTRAVTVRLPQSQWAALAGLAAQVELPPGRVARLLLDHAIGAMQRGDPELHRAVRTSRDG